MDKYEEMIGSYPPRQEIQMHDCTKEQAPAGFFSRGTYKGKAIVNKKFVQINYIRKIVIGS